MQPIIKDAHGVVRFKANTIVVRLLDFSAAKGFGPNAITRAVQEGEHSPEDHAQLAQLIGFSASAYGSQFSYEVAESDRLAALVLAGQPATAWKPMDTAPMLEDGRAFLVRRVNSEGEPYVETVEPFEGHLYPVRLAYNIDYFDRVTDAQAWCEVPA